ncbi:LysR substrate-binding domain-containing protein [Candidatus Pantoea multigeneris]|uniref:LysR family transcriptional regulator n=1 Tax=Candidatus Pantoea multigeneris TaxID=2608357 RepID=A0ABX0RCJ8_9GAMM|nr:LysR substrate-binding domain-containing protein [Pantoea multigeneris]NIF22031.1 LysR family transcriptional regulator [Pantoea multigeneris]
MSRSALPLNGIHAFLVTARHLNLTHAALELHITQGAVSRKIAALEAWLGFALFERHARGLRLTPQGKALLPEWQQGYDLLLSAAQKASRRQDAVRLKAPTCALRWLLPCLVALEQQRPDIHVELTTTLEHVSQLENFDAAMVYGKAQSQATVLFEEQITPVMSPDLPLPTQPEALGRMTFLHPTQDKRDWQLWLAEQHLSLTMTRNQHFATMDLAIGAALQGFGITVADTTLAASELRSGRLVAPFPLVVKTGASYSLLQRADASAHPALAEVVAWLAQSAPPPGFASEMGSHQTKHPQP